MNEVNGQDSDKEDNEDKEDKDEEEKKEADDEAEIAKLIKEEDINMIPENTDVSEIDKLTGMPKPSD